MKPTEYTVDALTGRYAVRNDSGPTWTVTKRKQCSCGGSTQDMCPHIKAVAAYLKNGGERAEPFEPIEPKGPKGPIEECPICGERTKWAGSHRYQRMWRCPKDAGHYWQWYGEEKVKSFFTDGRRTGIPAIDDMSTEEYKQHLDTLEEERYGSNHQAVGE